MINVKRKRNALVIVLVVFVIAGIWMFMGGHKFSKSGKDTPEDFNKFLDSCSDIERIQMLQALRQLPSFNKAEHIFNSVLNLNMSEIYVNYNDVEPQDVLKAVKDGKIDRSDISASAIRKALLWRGNFKAKYAYYYFDNETLDYHAMVQWAAGEVKVPQKKIETLSTYELEREVSQGYFSHMWEGLTAAQKETIIRDLNAKKGWGIKDLTNLAEVGQSVYSLVKNPQKLLSIAQDIWAISSYVLKFSFAEDDAVCMFIMTVSMIKSK